MLRDAGYHDTLLVDGRNLAPVVRAIANTRLVLRTFVSCLPFEAAWRECDRRGIALGSPEARQILEYIERRNSADAQRPIDPVRPDRHAIDYWYNQQAFDTTVQKFADESYGGDYWKAATHIFIPHREYTNVIRYGVGTIASAMSHQIHFDTTTFRSYDQPKAAMLGAADVMFEEACAAEAA